MLLIINIHVEPQAICICFIILPYYTEYIISFFFFYNLHNENRFISIFNVGHLPKIDDLFSVFDNGLIIYGTTFKDNLIRS